MNFRIDTQSKIISTNEAVNISQLVKVLKSWLPNGEWKAYEIRAETFLLSNPVVIHRPYWYDIPTVFTPHCATIEAGTGTTPPVFTTTNFCVTLEE